MSQFNNENILLVIASIVMLSVYYLKPSQEVNQIHDIGTYISGGIAVSQNKSIVLYDKWLEILPKDIRSIVYKISNEDLGKYSYQSQGSQFSDFAIVDADRGKVLYYRPPLRVVLFAVTYQIFGLQNSLYFQGLLGFLSSTALYLLVKKIYSKKIANISYLFILTNYSQIFFSQYTSPEILFQLFSLYGIYSLYLAIINDDRFHSILSGLVLGSLILIRIEGFLLTIPVFVIFLFQFLCKKTILKNRIINLFSLLFAYDAAILYLLRYSSMYLKSQIYNIQTVNNLHFVNMYSLLGILLLPNIIIISIFIKRFKQDYYYQKISSLLKYFKYLITCFLLLMLPFSKISWIKLDNTLFVRDFNPYIVLSWFVGIPILLLGLYGILYSFNNTRNNKAQYLLIISIPQLLIFSYSLFNSPIFPWGTRRLITFVIPILIIFAVKGFYEITTSFTKSKAVFMLGTLYIVLFNLVMISTLNKPQFHNYISQLDSFQKEIPRSTIIIEDLSSRVSKISLPLRYIYGLDSFSIADPNVNLDKAAKYFIKNDRPVYLILYPDEKISSYREIYDDKLIFNKIEEHPFLIDMVEWEFSKFSNLRTIKEYFVSVYSIEPVVL